MLPGLVYQVGLGNWFCFHHGCRKVLKGAKLYLFKKTLRTKNWASKHFMWHTCLEVNEKDSIGSGLKFTTWAEYIFFRMSWNLNIILQTLILTSSCSWRSILLNITNCSLHKNNLTLILRDQLYWWCSDYRTSRAYTKLLKTSFRLKDNTFFIKAGITLSFSKNAMLSILPLLANCTHYFLWCCL